MVSTILFGYAVEYIEREDRTFGNNNAQQRLLIQLRKGSESISNKLFLDALSTNDLWLKSAH